MAASVPERPSSAPRRPGASLPAWLPPLLLVGAGAAVYARSFEVPFLFDDHDAILANRHVRALWPPSVPLGAPPDLPVSGRPVVALSLAVNHALGGYRVFGYHLVNLALHLANGLFLFGILARSFAGRGARLAALASALIWIVHPLLSEAVVYVIQRTELLVSFFFLAALYACIRGWSPVSRRASPDEASGPSRAARGWHVAAVAAGFLAALSKEVAFALPLVVLLYDRAFVSGSFGAALARHRWLHGGLFASWAVLAWTVFGGARSRSVGIDHGVSALAYLQTQAGVILWYLKACFAPTGLALSHHWPIVERTTDALPELAAVSALFAGALGLARRAPRAGVPALGFFLVLAPSSSVVPIVTEVAAERRMYLPLAAVVVLTVLAARRLAVRVAGARGAVAARDGESTSADRAVPRASLSPVSPLSHGLAGLAVLAVFALGAATFARVNVYATAVSIWEDALVKGPENPIAQNNLAKAYQEAGRLADARAAFERAIALEPDDPIAHHNLGRLLAEAGELEAAERELEEAVRLDPRFAGAWNSLGNLASLRRDFAAAVERYERALALAPNHALAHGNLAAALEQHGRPGEAREHFERAAALEPESADVHYALGLFLARRGEWGEAARALARTLRLDPGREACREQLVEVERRAAAGRVQ